jgi:hypothetical protein
MRGWTGFVDPGLGPVMDKKQISSPDMSTSFLKGLYSVEISD